VCGNLCDSCLPAMNQMSRIRSWRDDSSILAGSYSAIIGVVSAEPSPRSHIQCGERLTPVKESVKNTAPFLGIAVSLSANCLPSWLALSSVGECVATERRIQGRL
jgi:hypothetical protein